MITYGKLNIEGENMKIKKVYIKNILSYNDEMVELNNDLNIFVGANGSGKSNFMNIIIYLLKRFCFRNYEVSNINGIERAGIKRYSIRQKNPLYGSSEDYFLQKHKLKQNEESLIDLTISFEKKDIDNLYDIKSQKDIVCHFLDKAIDNVQFMDDIYAVDKNKVKEIFDVKENDLSIGDELCLRIRESDNGWKIENDSEKYYVYMKYFSLIIDILNIINVKHNIKNPFVFFEAYRNNSSETTKVGITESNNQGYTNLQSWQNLLSLNYSIGTNSTYIMLATKKYGKLMRNEIEKENGLQRFYDSDEYKMLEKYFEKFEYNIKLKCISPEDNIYQFYLLKDSLEIEIDTISSGEREIINFIFGLFLEKLNDGIIIIDEPELHLHPNWQKKLIQILKEETENKNIQILFVTHSSSFITYNILNNIYRIYKEKGFSKCIRISDLIQQSDNDFRKNLSVINATNNEKIFFSNNVILVEGITDEILFKKIYESEIRKIPDGLEFVGICGKRNLDNFKNILEKLRIKYFFIGDFDNLCDFEELKDLFEIDRKKQKKDMTKNKNQTYAALELLDSIQKFIEDKNDKNYLILKNNYYLYNERFVKLKSNISIEEKKIIEQFIKNKYDENFYILKLGEIENYLGTGNSNKTLGFKKVISLLNDNSEYEKFKTTIEFQELKSIIENINVKICGSE